MNLLKMGKAFGGIIKNFLGREAKEETVHVAEAAVPSKGLGEVLKETAQKLRDKLKGLRGETPHAAAPDVPTVAAAKPSTPSAAAESLRQKVGTKRQTLEAQNPGMPKPAPKVETPEQAKTVLGNLDHAVKGRDINAVKANAIGVLDSPEGAKNARRVSDSLIEARKGVSDPAERKQLSALLRGSQKKQVDMMVKREAEMQSGRFHPDEVRGMIQSNLNEAHHLIAHKAGPVQYEQSLKAVATDLKRLHKMDPKAAEAEFKKFAPEHRAHISTLTTPELPSAAVAKPVAQAPLPQAAKPHPFQDQLGIHRPPAAPAGAKPVQVTTPSRPAANEPLAPAAPPQREAAFAPPKPSISVPAAGGNVRPGQEIPGFNFREGPPPAKPPLEYERPVLSDGLGAKPVTPAAPPPNVQAGSGIDLTALRREAEGMETIQASVPHTPHGQPAFNDADLAADLLKPPSRRGGASGMGL